MSLAARQAWSWSRNGRRRAAYGRAGQPVYVTDALHTLRGELEEPRLVVWQRYADVLPRGPRGDAAAGGASEQPRADEERLGKIFEERKPRELERADATPPGSDERE